MPEVQVDPSPSASAFAADVSVDDRSADASAPPAWMCAIALICVALGIGFRFYKLGGKVYWQDETLTSIHMSGRRLADVSDVVFSGRRIAASEFIQFQQIDPQSGFADALRALAKDDPKHPPLYFVLARAWVIVFGNSAATIRALSAVLSLAAIPAAYWLARELFSSRAAALAAVALVAVSPIQVLYAQEAREYSLWTITIFAASAALLRARRLDTSRAWALYFIACLVGILSHTLFFLVIVSHVAFVVLSGTSRREMYRFASALAMTALAFAPWAAQIYFAHAGLNDKGSWLNESPYSKANLLGRAAYGVASNFFDFFGFPPVVPRWKLAIPISAGMTVSVLAIIFLWRANRRAALFVVCMAAAPMAALLLTDLLIGGRRSTPYRYWIPFYVALEMAVAYWMAAPVMSQRRIRRVAGLALLIGGIASCAISSGARDWWSKGDGENILLKSAETINRETRPLLFSNAVETKLSSTLAMSRLLRSDVMWLIDPADRWPAPAPDLGNAFFFTDKPISRTRKTKYPLNLRPTAGAMVWKLAHSPEPEAP